MVSWNDAAEMNESVESDAFVMPSRRGVPSAGSPPRFITYSFSSMKRKRSTLLPNRVIGEEVGIADARHTNRPQHLTADDFDVLVVDGNRLRAVDLLDLVDQVALLLADAEDRENVGRIKPSMSGSPARPRSPS